MRLRQLPSFRRAVKRLSAPQRQAIGRALARLEANPADPSLRLHKLSGKLTGCWAISAGYDLRVVCQLESDIAHLLAVGSQDEVY